MKKNIPINLEKERNQLIRPYEKEKNEPVVTTQAKQAKQAIHIDWDIFNRLQKLRAELATPENKLKLKDLVNEALTIYLDSKTK